MYLCFDIGGTNIKAGMFSPDGTLIEKASTKTPSDYEGIIRAISEIAEKFSGFEACAIAVPGTCAPNEGQVIFCPNLTALNGKNLKNDLQTIMNTPIYLENDGNMAALGEYFFYEKNRIKNMIFLTLGTGLGGGAVLNGELLTSDISMFEAGHINIDPEGRRCGCGKRGCLETYVSVGGLLRTYNSLSSSKEELDSANKVYNLYKAGDKVASLAYEVLGGYLAIGMATLSNILVPQKIKIGGGLSEMADAFLPNTYRVFSRHVYPSYRDRVSIELSSLRNNAGLSGCAAMCISKK
ncbi:MAG: ROK family protein [Deferribacterales bacterium]